MRIHLLLGVAFVAMVTSGAMAEEAATAEADVHTPVSAEIIVTAPFERDRLGLLAGTTVLQGTELTREIRNTIGETLSRQAGVSSTSFGPNASRPILRGFQGERIRVLTDGIGSFDVSNTSVDHAVVVNPQLAERIEVLRGPASLLFGSNAVGGVVNVIDSRIPRSVPEEAVHVDILGNYSSAANERSVGGVLDIPITDQIVLHFDGSYYKSGDLDIGGFVLSKSARAKALASQNPDVQALAGLQDKLPNSAARTYQFAGGLALINEGGDLGFSVSHYDSLYGVPARYDLETGDFENVRLDVQQTRADVRGGINIGGDAFERLSLRAGYADYKHSEIDEDGNIGTTFLNKSFEGRLELVQAKRGVWKGASGIQLLSRDFNVVGDEAFVPKNLTTQIGIFTLQELDFGAFRAEASGRYERTRLQTVLDEFRGEPNAYNRIFNAYSGSVGASYGLFDNWRIGLNLSHTERAPSAEEVLANGPHAGTQAFEIGDRSFGKETNNGVELVLRGKGEGYSFEASAYYNRFKNYIYEDQTGEIEDDLPVFQFRSARARYFGAEIQGQVRVARFGDVDLGVDGLADYVDAKLLDGLGRVPRIPPFRVLGGVSLTNPIGNFRVEAEYAASQKKVAPNETQTDSYTLVNASLTARPFSGQPNISVVLQANNLFDVDARRHASFLKDFAPLPGRDFRISIRAVY